ncbi:MAG: site-2 protease family protein [Oscillospiraceae bacterium]|nr:site-2 protease family protein [Oscillospiraceae bacterium]
MSLLSGAFDPITILISAVVLLTAFPIHEYAHGYAAYKLGDDTAAMQGRLSLNPLVHLDPIGTVCMLLFGFGWAKPVPVNPVRFKKVSMKTGMAITAFAGPLSNIVLSFISYIIYKILLYVYLAGNEAAFIDFLLTVFSVMTSLNIGLAIFNLIPIPPLDGSRILFALLPERYYFKVMQYERYIRLGLLVLIFLGVLDTPLAIVRSFFFNLFDVLSRPIDIIFKMIYSF